MAASNNSVRTEHSQFNEIESDWLKMRDGVKGQTRVKRRRETYLPMPPAIKALRGVGLAEDRYNFFLSFAEYPERLQPTIDGIQGLIHSKNPIFELPIQIGYLEESVTLDGKSLLDFWYDITREIFTTGRIGLLAEIPDVEFNTSTNDSSTLRELISSGGPQTFAPRTRNDFAYLAQYPAESIINWRKKRYHSGAEASLVVLREQIENPSSIDEFSQDQNELYRVLRFGTDDIYTQQLFLYESGDDGFDQSDVFIPQRVGRVFNSMPFTVINAINLEFDVGPIPLISMGNKMLDIYRKSASYNRALYLTADPTIVRCGVEREESEMNTVVGGGQVWDFSNPDVKVNMLELNGDSIPFSRQSIVDDHLETDRVIGNLFQDNKIGVEAAETLRIRQGAKQLTIRSVVINAARGLERALKNVAVVMGANPDLVTFQPNLDFTEEGLTARELFDLTSALNAGAPISMESIHSLARRGGLTDLDYREEQQRMRQQNPVGTGTPRPDPFGTGL